MSVSLDGLHPTLMRPRVEAMLADPDAVELGIYVVSAFRSVVQQQHLWNVALATYGDPEIADNWVARPGTSNHGPKVDGYGIAVDLGIPGVRSLKGQWPDHLEHAVNVIATRHGLRSPMEWEDWHFEPIADWHPPAVPSLLLQGVFMGLAKSDDDAHAALVRHLFLDHLLREPESEDEANAWVGWYRAYGLDATIYGIVDSPEGQAVLAAKRKTLGL